MASLFQIRRGIDTGSLQNGELYYNQTSQSLQVGSDSDSIITLAKLNETNSGSFDISGDLFVSGNARIVGNLTFGDSDAIDTVTVVASFSSSLIPQSNNNFDLGDSTTYWKTGYISSITGSLSGSVNNVNITDFSASVSESIGNLNNTSSNHETRISNLEQHSSSVNDFTASITSSYNATSESLNVVSQSLIDVSSSYIATSQSFDIVSSSLLTFSSSQYNTDSSSFDSRLDSVETTASVLTQFSASISTSVGLLQQFSSSEYKIDSSSFDSQLHGLEEYTASLKAAFGVSGSGVNSVTTIYGDLKVEGTQSIINSENLAVKDSLIYLNNSSSVTNPDLGIVGNYNDGTYAHTGIYRESLNGKWRVFDSLTDEPSGSVNDGHPSFRLADFEANEVSASINGIGRVGAYSTSVDIRLVNVESTSSNLTNRVNSIENYTTSVSTSVGLLQTFSSSQYKTDSSSFDNRVDLVEATASYLNTTFSTSVDSRLDLVETTASYLNTTFSTSVNSRITLTETTSSYLYTTFSTSVDSRIDALENFSASQYISDSSSFDTRISASTLTFNDTTNQNGIDFTKVGTQVSAVAAGLSTTSSVLFSSITSSGDISSSATIYADAIVANTIAGDFPVTTFNTNGTYGSIVYRGATSRSLQASNNANFDESTFSITGSFKVSGSISGSSIDGIGNVTLYSTSVASRLAVEEFKSTTFATTGSNTFKGNEIISGNLDVTGTITAYELHTIIQSSSVIFSSGSNQIGDQLTDILTITGSLNQTGSTSFSELTGSLFAFSASLDSRLNSGGSNLTTLSASIYQTDATQSNNITINSASAWGAFQSASSYSASLVTTINNLSSSNYQTNATQSFLITAAFATASVYSASLAASITGSTANVTALSTSVASRLNVIETTFATTGSNTFKANQIISGSLSVTGDVIAYSTSDERLKDNIQLISNPIQKVNELRGVEFDWKDGMPKAGQHDYGVIAQDVIKVMPELVNQRPDGYYAVDYDKIIGLLIEVVKEQEKRIKDLENKIGS